MERKRALEQRGREENQKREIFYLSFHICMQLLVESPLDTVNHAGPTFAYYYFITDRPANAKSQVVDAVKVIFRFSRILEFRIRSLESTLFILLLLLLLLPAVKVFPQSPQLQTALSSVQALPEISYPITIHLQ